MALGQIEPWVTDNLFQLQELCIAPSHQTQGIGRNLLQQLRAQVRAHDQVGSLYLLTNRASAAETFYAKLGFANSAQKLVMGMR